MSVHVHGADVTLPAMRAATLALILLVPSALAQDAKPDGKSLYIANCARCHGRDGKARPDYAKKGAIDLNDPDWQASRSDAEIRATITNGSKGTLMEPFKDKLTTAEIDAVVAYVRKLAPAK